MNNGLTAENLLLTLPEVLQNDEHMQALARGITSRKMYFVSGFAEKTGSMQGGLTRDTMWRLDSSFSLDGGKKLNAAIIREEL